MVLGIDGSSLGEFPAHYGPRRVTTDAEGDIFVLGRGGFALRYSPDGRLVARWRVPDPEASLADIAVDHAGQVSIAHWKLLTYRLGVGGICQFDSEPYESDCPFPAAPA